MQNNKKHIEIYKGKAFTLGYNKSYQKIIAFDLDETLGSFSELYILWKGLNIYLPNCVNDMTAVFRELIMIYPEFLRPGILHILQFLYNKKTSGECSHVCIYTNNQCIDGWVDLILQYFNNTVSIGSGADIVLFDKAITAYHPLSKRDGRTTHQKTYSDLIRCTMISKSSEICFIDNLLHKDMLHDRVYYIQPKSYIHSLSTDEIIDRFMTKWDITEMPSGFESVLYEWFLMNNAIKNHSLNRSGNSLVVSQKIMYYLKEYFLLSTKSPKTRKILVCLGKFTRKKRV